MANNFSRANIGGKIDAFGRIVAKGPKFKAARTVARAGYTGIALSRKARTTKAIHDVKPEKPAKTGDAEIDEVQALDHKADKAEWKAAKKNRIASDAAQRAKVSAPQRVSSADTYGPQDDGSADASANSYNEVIRMSQETTSRAGRHGMNKIRARAAERKAAKADRAAKAARSRANVRRAQKGLATKGKAFASSAFAKAGAGTAGGVAAGAGAGATVGLTPVVAAVATAGIVIALVASGAGVTSTATIVGAGVDAGLIEQAESESDTFFGFASSTAEYIAQLALDRYEADVPYVWGGLDWENGMDCSGLVTKCYEKAGITGIYHGSGQQMDLAKKSGTWLTGKDLTIDNLLPGMVLCRNGHVGIYVGEGKLVEEKNPDDGIGLSTFNASDWIGAGYLDGSLLEEYKQAQNGTTITIPKSADATAGYTVTCLDADGWHLGFKSKATGVGEPDRTVWLIWKQKGCKTNDDILTIDGRYLIACTTTFGKVGDAVDFKLEDGTVIPCIICDTKSPNDSNCTRWGHTMGGKTNVIEFEVTLAAKNRGNPGHKGFHADLKAGTRVVSCTNRGSRLKQFNHTSGSTQETK